MSGSISVPKYIVKFRDIEISISVPPTADMKMVMLNLDFHGKAYYLKMREYGIKFSVPELNDFFAQYFNEHM